MSDTTNAYQVILLMNQLLCITLFSDGGEISPSLFMYGA